MDDDQLRQISEDNITNVTTLQASSNGDTLDNAALKWAALRSVYNIEINNPNNTQETVYIYIGDSTDNQRTLKRRYTIGAYAVVCLCINIRSPVIVYRPSNTAADPYNTRLYGAVGTNPVNIAVTYYDEFGGAR